MNSLPRAKFASDSNPPRSRAVMNRPVVHPSEGAAAATSRSTPMGALMAGHVLRDGELVLLILRPSRWFIILSSLKFLTAVAILMILCAIFAEKLHPLTRQYLEIGALLIASRLMWAILQWMGRLYMLTDMRILRLSGVFNVEIYDCPLRRVARTLLEAGIRERLLRIGSIVIIPQDEEMEIGHWHMIARPKHVHEQVIRAIARAKQGGH